MADELAITGYASRFGTFDSDADMVMPGAFTKTLLEFHPVMLWHHDPAKSIGRWDEVREDDLGLWVRGIIYDTDAIFKVRNRMVRGLSIGYRAMRPVNLKNGGRELHEVELAEISLTPIPMHRDCLLSIA